MTTTPGPRTAREALRQVFSLGTVKGAVVVRATPDHLADECLRELAAQGFAVVREAAARADVDGLSPLEAINERLVARIDELEARADVGGPEEGWLHPAGCTDLHDDDHNCLDASGSIIGWRDWQRADVDGLVAQLDEAERTATQTFNLGHSPEMWWQGAVATVAWLRGGGHGPGAGAMSVRTLYAVAQGSYSDKTIWCLFETRELAEQYVAAYTSTWDEANAKPDNTYGGQPNRDWRMPYIEEYQLWDVVPHVSYARKGYEWHGQQTVAYHLDNGIPEPSDAQTGAQPPTEDAR